jgi:hypothetical protein
MARVVTIAETRMDAGANRGFNENRENQGNTRHDAEEPIVAKANGRAGVK